GLSSRSLQLTWISMACLPALLFWAKLNGLYDRDESLIRKTTLDEAPKLFQLATLCALVTWLWSGLFVSGGKLDRHQALFLWLGLASLLILARSLARQLAAAHARGRRLLGRVRRSARRHADGRAPLRPHPLLGGREAGVRPRGRIAGATCDRAPDARLRHRDQARQPRPGFLPPVAR